MDKRQILASCHEHRHHIGMGLAGALLVIERWLKLFELAFEVASGILRVLWNRIRKAPNPVPPTDKETPK